MSLEPVNCQVKLLNSYKFVTKMLLWPNSSGTKFYYLFKQFIWYYVIFSHCNLSNLYGLT